MNVHVNWRNALEWILLTFQFIKNNFWVILSLGFVAAAGRIIQLRAFGPISPTTNILLEILIEGTRITLILYVLGLANIKSGASRIKWLIT
jgi:putative exporter of polyketide antibiotics